MHLDRFICCAELTVITYRRSWAFTESDRQRYHAARRAYSFTSRLAQQIANFRVFLFQPITKRGKKLYLRKVNEVSAGVGLHKAYRYILFHGREYHCSAVHVEISQRPSHKRYTMYRRIRAAAEIMKSYLC